MGLGVMIIQPKLRQGRRWGIGVGTLLILLGLVAIGFAPTVNIPVSFLLGWLFLFAGFAQVVYVFQYHQQCRQNEYFVWKLLLGILYLQAGMFVLLSPVISGLTLALAVGISIFSQSIIQVLSAFDMRPRVGWSCNLFGGFVGVVLSIFVMAQWPSGAASSLGLWFGINILVDGLGLLVHASIVR
jgi:uncharacterized membrane protein HdeD (DUF308 family)